MVIPIACEKNRPLAHKNVHLFDQIQATLPSDALLYEMLKPLEQKLQKRPQMLRFATKSVYPLWFLSETERNVFLWRNNHSLREQEAFQFWISIDHLIERRIHQLQRFTEENLFLSPELTGHTRDFQRAQIEYLEAFSHEFKKIRPHAHALSVVGATLENEQTGNWKEHVVLPIKGNRSN